MQNQPNSKNSLESSKTSNKLKVINDMDLKEATGLIQDMMAERDGFSSDETAYWEKIKDDAMAGEIGAGQKATEFIAKVMDRHGITVKGMETYETAYEIYKYAWGMDAIEELYNQPDVDEIRVNSYNMIKVQRRGKNESTDIKLKDNEHVMMIIGRLVRHDRGVGLTESTPSIESMRRDGTRITATCPPLSKTATLVLRKHDTFKMDLENLTKAGTLDKQIHAYLRLLVSGRSNILLSGGCGSGKTSLLRYLVSFLHPGLRIISMENDVELKLGEHYPARDIVEFEEHPELKLTLRHLFRIALRYSPDLMIIGEMRGVGEADETIKACTRGHDGSMGTGHFNSVEEAVEGTALMLLEEGKNLPLDLAKLQVARAFNIVVQMYSSTVHGIKKITNIAEIWPEGNNVEVRNLVTWKPNPDNYFQGEWVIENLPSERLLKKMHQYGVNIKDFKKMEVVT